jgi:hypothetical protein
VSELAGVVERGDLDELTRLVDLLCDVEDWDGLVDLAARCRAAVARGKQLWPIASYIDYRLALDAPGRWAASRLESGAGRFALGPLPEVAASTHRWADLAPYLPMTPAAAMFAHERVVRGDDLSGDPRAVSLPPVLDLPLILQPWEPSYAMASYEADGVEAPFPSVVVGEVVAVVDERGETLDDPMAVTALNDLAGAWTTESNGRSSAIAVAGSASSAVRALGAPAPRLSVVSLADALAMSAWAAASGGAHGRRRGAAAGRFAAWWATAAVTGLLDEWPIDPSELGSVAAGLRWYQWDAGEPESGWVLRLAVEDPEEGLAWAVAAVDSA